MRLALRLAAPLALVPAVAFAQSTGGQPVDSGLGTGLLRPIVEIDHLVAMLAVGAWATALGGDLVRKVPATFFSLMLIGMLIGAMDLKLPAPGVVLAMSVIAVGFAIALRMHVTRQTALGATGIFALFHGNAHGIQLSDMHTPIYFTVGFALTSAALLAGGVWLGQRFGDAEGGWVPRGAGQAIAVLGVLLLVAS